MFSPLTELNISLWLHTELLCSTHSTEPPAKKKHFIVRSVYSHDRRVLSTPVGYSHDKLDLINFCKKHTVV